MKRYRVLKRVPLGFLTSQDQATVFYGPDDGAVLHREGDSLYVTTPQGCFETITQPHALEVWTELGYLEEIK